MTTVTRTSEELLDEADRLLSENIASPYSQGSRNLGALVTAHVALAGMRMREEELNREYNRERDVGPS